MVRRHITYNSLLSFQVINKCYFCEVHETDIDPLETGLKPATDFPHDNSYHQECLLPPKFGKVFCRGVYHNSTSVSWTHSGTQIFMRVGGRIFRQHDYHEEIPFYHKEKKFLGLK